LFVSGRRIEVRNVPEFLQGMNKVATGVQLRFDIKNSIALQDSLKERLIKQGGKRVTAEGILIIEAKRFRTQEKNRLDAISRLIKLIQLAAIEKKLRRKTRPTLTARAARVRHKRKEGEQKKLRRYNPDEME